VLGNMERQKNTTKFQHAGRQLIGKKCCFDCDDLA
jgi:hypothetical protein